MSVLVLYMYMYMCMCVSGGVADVEWSIFPSTERCTGYMLLGEGGMFEMW